ncbi:hypothetical protein ACS3QZ_06085 [Shimia sp. W99]
MTDLNRRAVLLGGVALTIAGLPALAAEVPAPQAGKGLIVFYRGGGQGAAVRYTIEGPDGLVGEMKQGAVLFSHMPPGDHLYRVPDANNTEGVISIAAGETKFIDCYLDAATNTGKLQFREVSADRAMKTISKY